ncbi:hypothetical protein ACHAWF_011844, partial [Thalassiosira exigua]
RRCQLYGGEGYRRGPRPSAAPSIRYDDETDSSLAADPASESAIDSRPNDFSERSWWMVDVASDAAESSTQGASALARRCMHVRGWDEAQTRRILAAYRQFLTLKKKLGDWDATLLSPCHLVDQMWHQHILDNFNYYHDMLLLCGRFVGHNPDGALDLEAKRRRDRFTRECLCQHFGRYDPEIWDFNGENEGGRGNNAGDANRGGLGIPENGGELNASDPSLDQTITVRLKDQNREETMFKIKMSTSLMKVFSMYVVRKGLAVYALRFYFDGESIHPRTTDTASTLDMDDNDHIDVILAQCGC